MYFVVSDLQNLKMAVEKYCINLVITDIYNLKMAVINSDVFCSFRFIEFESGSHYTVCTAVHKSSLQYSCTQNKFTVQLYPKQVYRIAVHKPVYSIGILKTSLQHRCTQYSFQ